MPFLPTLQAVVGRCGGRGLFSLRKHLERNCDRDSGTLTPPQLLDALLNFGANATLRDAEELVGLLGKEIASARFHSTMAGERYVEISVVIDALEPQLSARRAESIAMAYTGAMSSARGTVDRYERSHRSDFRTILGQYNAGGHPDVRNGNITAEQAHAEFADTFCEMFDVGSAVSAEDFSLYYKIVSAGYASEAQFVQTLQGCWGGDVVLGSAGGRHRREVGRLTDAMGALAAPASVVGHESPGAYDPVTGRNVAMENQAAAANEAWLQRHSEAQQQGGASATDETMSRLRELPVISGDRQQETLRRHLRGYDQKDQPEDGTLSLGEFGRAMREFGVRLSEGEIRQLLSIFAAGGGQASYPEECKLDYPAFIRALRYGTGFNIARQEVVQDAYRMLERAVPVGTAVTVAAARELYDAEAHPHARSGRATPYQLLRELEAAVDDGSGSGLLTEDAFTEYYATLSHEIKSDAVFEEMVCYCWALAYTEVNGSGALNGRWRRVRPGGGGGSARAAWGAGGNSAEVHAILAERDADAAREEAAELYEEAEEAEAEAEAAEVEAIVARRRSGAAQYAMAGVRGVEQRYGGGGTWGATAGRARQSEWGRRGARGGGGSGVSSSSPARPPRSPNRRVSPTRGRLSLSPGTRPSTARSPRRIRFEDEGPATPSPGGAGAYATARSQMYGGSNSPMAAGSGGAAGERLGFGGNPRDRPSGKRGKSPWRSRPF